MLNARRYFGVAAVSALAASMLFFMFLQRLNARAAAAIAERREAVEPGVCASAAARSDRAVHSSAPRIITPRPRCRASRYWLTSMRSLRPDRTIYQPTRPCSAPSAKIAASFRPRLREMYPVAQKSRNGKAKATVRLDPDTASTWFADRLTAAGAVIQHGSDPCVLPKAKKNAQEIAGARAAHRRDGVAFARERHDTA